MGASFDYMLRELGIELLAARGGFACLVHDRMVEPLEVQPHHHDGHLQFDLIFGARGRVYAGERWLAFGGAIALTAYPGQSHGYTVEPAGKDAMVFHLKVPAGGGLACVRERAFSQAAPLGVEQGWLADAGRGVSLRTGHVSSPPAGAIVEILRMLAAWPTGARSLAPAPSRRSLHPLVEEATSLIESRLDEPPTLEELGESLGVSSRHLSRVFLGTLGVTPHRYAVARRLDRAKTGLLTGERAIGAVGDELGFSSPATFTRWFRHETGMTPTEFRNDPAVF